jgi:uncharacterized protein DUF6600
MRLFVCICCIAMVAGFVPGFAQNMTPGEAVPVVEASAPLPPAVLPPAVLRPDWSAPGRVGQVSLVSGNVDLRASSGSTWADAELNQPIFAGEALRTDPRARGEIRIGANTIGLSNGSEIEIASLRDGVTQIILSRGRIGLHLRHAGENETVEVDVPQGGVWLLPAGRYDIEAGDAGRPLRVAVFGGTAHFAGAGGDRSIEGGQVAVLTEGADAVSIEAVTADNFVAWCRDHDYDDTRLAAPYYVSRYLTGYAELDSAGIWKINEQYGPVWFPTQPAEWAPYRFGHWSWIAPWGWTWLDDQPWGFAPSHYGRWALIDDHWAWVPGDYVARPLYAPAVVAFLGTPGVGLSSEEGATVAWFPLAPGEAYWPGYSRDLDYVRNLNLGTVRDVAAIGVRADGEPPLETFNKDFANRLFATVVPRAVFTNGRPIAPALVSLPEKRLENAPVLMASPQIAPASTQRVARLPTANPPVTHAAVQLSRKAGAKPVHAASIPSRSRAQAVVLRGAHLRAPSYAGQPRTRQMVVLRVAHSRGGPGKKG